MYDYKQLAVWSERLVRSDAADDSRTSRLHPSGRVIETSDVAKGSLSSAAGLHAGCSASQRRTRDYA